MLRLADLNIYKVTCIYIYIYPRASNIYVYTVWNSVMTEDHFNFLVWECKMVKLKGTYWNWYIMHINKYKRTIKIHFIFEKTTIYSSSLWVDKSYWKEHEWDFSVFRMDSWYYSLLSILGLHKFFDFNWYLFSSNLMKREIRIKWIQFRDPTLCENYAILYNFKVFELRLPHSQAY